MKSCGLRSFRREISRSTTRTPATRAKCFRISTNWPETTEAVQSWSCAANVDMQFRVHLEQGLRKNQSMSQFPNLSQLSNPNMKVWMCFSWMWSVPALEEKSRFVAPLEMLSSQVLPVTSAHAKACMAPKLELSAIPQCQISKMSGNSMNVPCVAAVLLTTILALDYRWWCHMIFRWKPDRKLLTQLRWIIDQSMIYLK